MKRCSYAVGRSVVAFGPALCAGTVVVVAGFLLGGCAFDTALSLPGFGAVAEPVGADAPAAVQREYNRALVSLQNGDAADAEDRLQRFIEAHPSYTNAYVNLAILRERRGDTAGAVHLLQHAIEIDGKNVYALNRLGVIQRRSGDFAAAEQSWLEATRVNPAYPNAWYNLGVLYDLYLRDLQAAVNHYQRYLQLMGGPDGQADAAVKRWIMDLERRIDAAPQTANATEAL